MEGLTCHAEACGLHLAFTGEGNADLTCGSGDSVITQVEDSLDVVTRSKEQGEPASGSSTHWQPGNLLSYQKVEVGSKEPYRCMPGGPQAPYLKRLTSQSCL